MAELVDALVSGTSVYYRLMGSSPIPVTNIKLTGVLLIDSAVRRAAENGNTDLKSLAIFVFVLPKKEFLP